MRSSHPSADRAGAARQGGFTVVELMVGIVIGLLASLAVTQVLVNFEGQKRTTTGAADAQINGALALDQLVRRISSAGYGFASTPNVIGCALSARYNNAAIPGFPERLAPVVITPNASDQPDALRILSSGKQSFALVLPVVGSGYDPSATEPETSLAIQFRGTGDSVRPPVVSGGKVTTPGDLMVAVADGDSTCEVFAVTPRNGRPLTYVPRDDDAARWNPENFPTQAYPAGSYLVNLGEPVDVTFGVNNKFALTANTLSLGEDAKPSYSGAVELFPDIPMLKALYGKDTSSPPDGTVDVWDRTTPTTNDGWRQVVAIRVAIVARSVQQEREDVTVDVPLWDVGTAIAIAGTVDCNDGSKCLEMDVSNVPDWKRFRYRVFDTIVPLRNMLWNS